ncbi:MAG: hypothetical protein L0H26_04390 [Microlunatus sp.]|nr:hypothetical protein [Microlunatus sp.]
MTLPVRLWGAVAVDGSEAPLTLGPARQRSVLAVLLLNEGRPVPGADLVGRVWGQCPPPAADQALRSYLCRLRKIVAGAATLRVQRRDGGYVATVDPAELDLAVFRRWSTQARVAAREGRTQDAVETWGRALELVDGDPLVGVGSDWLDERRRSLLRERHAEALERNDLALSLGSADLVATDAEARLVEDPYDERLAGQAVVALARLGRTADALAVVARIRDLLREELGIDPGRALQQLHSDVLRGVVPSVAAAAPVRVTLTGAARTVPHQLPPMARGFVDREAESAELDRILAVSDDGETTDDHGAAVAVITGPAGVGKTALALRWARHHASRFPDGLLYVDLHGFDPACRPTSSQVALRGFLVALGLDPVGIPADLPTMVSTYRTLISGRRVLVVADDACSSEQVRPLLPPGPGSAGLVTSRRGPANLVTGLGAAVIGLGPLDDHAARALLTLRLGPDRTSTSASAVGRIVQRCEGLPLALAIVAGRAASLPTLPLEMLADELDDDSRRLAALNGGEDGTDLVAVVIGSLRAVSRTAGSVAQLLAAAPAVRIRRPLVGVLLDRPSKESDAVLRELLETHLLEPDGFGCFRMHDLVRLVLQAHSAGSPGRTEETGRTEEPDADEAIDRLLRFLVTEDGGPGHDPTDLLVAVEFAQRTSRHIMTCDLAAALELPLESTGRWLEMIPLGAAAVAAAERLEDDRRLIVALIGRGRGLIGLRRFVEATTDLHRARVIGDRVGVPGLLAQAHRALARLAAHQRRFDLALPHDQRGLELHRQAGNVIGEAHAYNAIGWHQAHLDRPRAALQNCRRGLMIFVEHQDRPGQARTQDSIGYALTLLGRTAEARDALEHAAALCRHLGWRVMLANTLSRLVETHQRLGDHVAAQRTQVEIDEIVQLVGQHVREP